MGCRNVSNNNNQKCKHQQHCGSWGSCGGSGAYIFLECNSKDEKC